MFTQHKKSMGILGTTKQFPRKPVISVSTVFTAASKDLACMEVNGNNKDNVYDLQNVEINKEISECSGVTIPERGPIQLRMLTERETVNTEI